MERIHIVYSFIGKLPEYIVDTVWQSRLFFKDDIWLITNDLESPYILKLNELKLDVKIISYEDILDNDITDLSSKYKSIFYYVEKLKGREEIMLRSFERFFLLRNLIKNKSLNNVIFLELDNTIYDTPYNWLHLLKEKEFTAMGHNDNTFIKHEFNCDVMATGICYMRDLDAASNYCDFLISYCKSMLDYIDVFPSEMNATFRYFKKYPERVDTLPIIWKTDGIPEYYYNRLDVYDSIFDGASLGIMLFGADPVHTDNKIIIGQKAKWTNIDLTTYPIKWECDSEDRNIPYILRPETNKWYKINNLHVHSKNLKPSLSKMY